ncbi:MAG TPA: septation protein IspZ [Phenylobacterium sp.]|jgi:intracellular septation protein
MSPKTKIWIRAFVDYGGLAAFLLTTIISGNPMLASGVIIVTSLLALAVGFALERRLAPIPLVTAVIGVVFGAMTLMFHATWILQIKLTILETGFGLFLLGGLARGKNPLKALMGDALHLPEPVIRTLTLRYALMFFAIAIGNEIVRNTQTFRIWGFYKAAAPFLIFLFALTQAPLMMKHMPEEEAKPEPPPPADAA